MTESSDASGLVFLADECTFTQTVRLIRDHGCEVVRVQDVDLSGVPDAEVFQAAQERNAVLVTTDRGFGDIRTYPPSSHHGIIVLKVSPDPEQVRAVHRTLRQLLDTEELFSGTLFIVDEQKYRKRMSP
jgi:predicted nuclease of predicted toxin-antitoxin system